MPYLQEPIYELEYAPATPSARRNRASALLPYSRHDINTLNLKCLFYTQVSGPIERRPNDRTY